LTTKIHALVDALGNPVKFILSGGNDHDSKFAIPLLSDVNITGTVILADKAYDSDKILQHISSCGAVSNIPPTATRKVQRDCDYHLYKERHLVECFFGKLKNFRRIATRYDKNSASFLAFVYLASVCILLK